uniref:Protein kinase domain-containing protein n=1 Tax=Macrostomum lignano TaxID=282301 RepID=A0A1I8FSM6_9PLAT
MHELGLLLHIRGDFKSLPVLPDAEWFLFVRQSVVLFKSTRGELQISQLKTIPHRRPGDAGEPHRHLSCTSFHDLNICHKLNDKTSRPLPMPDLDPFRSRSRPPVMLPQPAVPQRPGRAPDRAAGPGVRAARVPAALPRALLRVYRFPYFPPGLWPRLAARLHSTVADLKERARFFYAGNRRRDQPRCCSPPTAQRGLPAAVLLLHRGGRLPGAAARSAAGSASCSASGPASAAGAAGFMVKHDDGRFGIQLGDSGVELELCVLSQSRNFAPIGLLVDEVDLLLDTCFEEDGYADVAEDDGESNADEGLVGGATSGLMRRLVPCPECLSSPHGRRLRVTERSVRAGTGLARQGALVRLRDYALSAPWTSRPLRCPRCGAAPEAAQPRAGAAAGRHPSSGQNQQISWRTSWTSSSSRLTSPSSCASSPVAEGSSSTRSLESAGATNEAPLGGIGGGLAGAAGSPFLVAFRGICLEPLCFLTELAPLGSLAEVREEARKQRPGTALRWAASSATRWRTSVLYRDLKSDNVLVFSKDPAARLHRQAGRLRHLAEHRPAGHHRQTGDPGYMAPEVLRDCTYDE